MVTRTCPFYSRMWANIQVFQVLRVELHAVDILLPDM